jgi:hypothetical protein
MYSKKQPEQLSPTMETVRRAMHTQDVTLPYRCFSLMAASESWNQSEI